MVRLHLSTLIAALLALGLGAVAASAQAEGPAAPAARRLTDRGRWLLSGAVGGSWSNDRADWIGALEHWRVYGTPAATYFARDRIGVGLAVSASASDTVQPFVGYRDYGLAAGVEAAFEIPLGTRLGLLFRPFVGYQQQWRDYRLDPSLLQPLSTYPGDDSRPLPGSDRAQLGYVRTWLGLQLLVHLSSSVALGVGPDIWADFIVRSDDSPVVGRFANAVGPSAHPGQVRLQVGLSGGLLFAF